MTEHRHIPWCARRRVVGVSVTKPNRYGHVATIVKLSCGHSHSIGGANVAVSDTVACITPPCYRSPNAQYY